ncbi:hypothetical protein F5144DRAFT_582240 [Chaetomium tenue]|uniref:Uncharacterized protein n=1 Tax=Chaetomium tenue TaxID=1854479 RepID=A0ACB7NXZ8_9PEZI|nr:hypothetical protein F5144DRAFT_582240 [Chaetomium globosum]
MCDSTAYVDARSVREGSHANKVRDSHSFAIVCSPSTYPRHCVNCRKTKQDIRSATTPCADRDRVSCGFPLTLKIRARRGTRLIPARRRSSRAPSNRTLLLLAAPFGTNTAHAQLFRYRRPASARLPSFH